jgi:transposase
VIPQGVQVFVALEAIDMRWSFDRLVGIAQEQIGYDARCGALFVFFGKRKSALKVLFSDGTGFCILYKRLHDGTFRVPEATSADSRHVEIDQSELDALLDGLALERKMH